MIISQLLAGAGADIINLGAEANPDQVAATVNAKHIEAILISTHNGMALEYARRLKEEFENRKIDIPVVMGGILNQKVEDAAMPIDVTSDLKQLGFFPCPRLETRFKQLLEFQMDGEENQKFSDNVKSETRISKSETKLKS
jgi:methylmalonyl-CoA mutase cobalamin-binding subunit